MRFHLHVTVEQMQDDSADENNGVARNDENRKPRREVAIIGIVAPVADAQSDDAAEQQAFVGNRIEDDA